MVARLAIGLAADVDHAEVSAALVRMTEFGLTAHVETLAHVVLTADDHGTSGASSKMVLRQHATGLAEFVESSMAQRLSVAASRVVTMAKASSIDDVLVIGLLDDPVSNGSHEVGALEQQLAERTGITTIGGFAARDRAAGGAGGPLSAVVDWMLAHDATRARLAVHIERTGRLTIIPAGAGPVAVRVFETGPGTSLIDAFVKRFAPDAAHDSAGRFAVQGRLIKSLVRRWAAHVATRAESITSVESPTTIESLLSESIEQAMANNWSLADLLCTATHFVAAASADAARRLLAAGTRIDECVFLGRGTQNGFLLRLLEEQFRSIGVRAVPLSGAATESFEAIAAAVLACLALDGVETNLPAVTGARGPRLVGDFTPGTPVNWCRCIEWMHRSGIASAQLRAA